MGQPDFAQAKEYVTARLKTELPPGMRYHSLFHTVQEVLPAVDRLAACEQVNGEDLLLLRTAALFHDLGIVVQYREHEIVSARFAAEVLPTFGYSSEQIERVRAMIMATRLPQSPRDLCERILADADLDVLGRSDFLARNQDLRDELTGLGQETSDENWYHSQLQFVQNHRYFTCAAQSEREEMKQANIHAMNHLLETARQARKTA
jgi:uncharacterized protein